MIPPPCNRVPYFFDWLQEVFIEFMWLSVTTILFLSQVPAYLSLGHLGLHCLADSSPYVNLFTNPLLDRTAY